MDIPINWDSIDSSVKQFGFEGETKIAKVVSVYDGDTIKVVFPVVRKLYKFNSSPHKKWHKRNCSCWNNRRVPNTFT